MLCTYCIFLCASQVAAVCTYVHITWQHVSSPRLPSTQERGPERSPFSSIPAGIFIFSDRVKGCSMYIVYIVPGDTPGAPFLRPVKGTRTVPFFNQPCGAFYYNDLAWNKSASHVILDPGSTFVNIFQDHLWLVIVILKSLNLVVSCIPVLYYVYLHMFYAF